MRVSSDLQPEESGITVCNEACKFCVLFLQNDGFVVYCIFLGNESNVKKGFLPPNAMDCFLTATYLLPVKRKKGACWVGVTADSTLYFGKAIFENVKC